MRRLLGSSLVGVVARSGARLQTKLLVAFLVIVSLVIVLGAGGITALNDSNRRTAELIDAERKVSAYRQIQSDTASQLYRISAALFAGEPRALDDAVRQLHQFGYDLDRLQYVARDEAELLVRVRADYDQFVVVMKRLVDLIRHGETMAAHNAQLQDAQPLADRLERITNELVNKAEADMAAGIDASSDAYRESQRIVVALIAASIVLALVLGRTISLSVIGPITEIGARLRKIALGDFAQQLAVDNRDELGELAANVNRTSTQLGQLYAELRTEQERSEALLLNTLPRSVVERLRRGETVIADRIESATILFSDIVGFTAVAARLPPEQLINLLDTLFARFDALAAQLGLEKIKTIGDGYMVAGGVLEPRSDHAAAVIEMALAMQQAADAVGTKLGEVLQLRIGVHSGPLIAGVVGTHKLVYDVWGDTVNTASRMEEAGAPGKVHLSAATFALVSGAYTFEPLGQVDIKGKGPLETYFLGTRRDSSSPPALPVSGCH